MSTTWNKTSARNATNAMFVVVLAVAAAAANVHVLGDACPAIAVNWERVTNMTVSFERVEVHLVDRPLWRAEAWTAARLLTSRAPAIVVVACRSPYADEPPPIVGVAFADVTPGMDCGRRFVDEAFASIDAFDERARWSVKVARLVERLGAWHAARSCSIGSEGVRATVFWVLVGALFTIANAYWRR